MPQIETGTGSVEATALPIMLPIDTVDSGSTILTRACSGVAPSMIDCFDGTHPPRQVGIKAIDFEEIKRFRECKSAPTSAPGHGSGGMCGTTLPLRSFYRSVTTRHVHGDARIDKLAEDNVRHKRRKRHAIGSRPSGETIERVARAARYVGSAEHKAYPSTAGPPALRSDATPCDPTLSFDLESEYPRDAMGHVDWGGAE